MFSYISKLISVCFVLQVSDAVDGLLDELIHLNDQVQNAESIYANPTGLKEQISENQVRYVLNIA